MTEKQVSGWKSKNLLRKIAEETLTISMAFGISACVTPNSNTPKTTNPPAVTYNAAQLRTGNQTYDAYDTLIITYTAKNNIPDPMLIKAEIAQESDFSATTYNNENPCNYDDFLSGQDGSWSLMQVNRGCTELYHASNVYATNPDGSFSMRDAIDPNYNLNYALPIWKSNLDTLKAEPMGCSEALYLLRTLAEWNAGSSPQNYTSCTESTYDPRDYVPQVLAWYDKLAALANWTEPFDYQAP